MERKMDTYKCICGRTVNSDSNHPPSDVYHCGEYAHICIFKKVEKREKDEN